MVYSINTRIAGIPCQVIITSIYGEHKPAKIVADPDDCYEAEYPELNWSVYDRRGYRATWLEKKLTDQEIQRIDKEVFDYAKSECSS